MHSVSGQGAANILLQLELNSPQESFLRDRFPPPAEEFYLRLQIRSVGCLLCWTVLLNGPLFEQRGSQACAAAVSGVEQADQGVGLALQQSVPLAGLNATCVPQDVLERGLAVAFRNEEGQGASLLFVARARACKM